MSQEYRQILLIWVGPGGGLITKAIGTLKLPLGAKAPQKKSKKSKLAKFESTPLDCALKRFTAVINFVL
jgi:hypothetical protein